MLRFSVARSTFRSSSAAARLACRRYFSNQESATATAAESTEANTVNPDSLSARAFVIEPIGAHQQTLVWLHGIGDLKQNFKLIFDSMTLNGVRLVVPESPQVPISIFQDRVMSSWFDIPSAITREQEPLAFEDDRMGILLAAHSVFELLEHEAKLIPSDKIILGGASVGGALAIHAGLRHKSKLAGIISVSGYTPLLTEYPKFLRKANRETPILAIHGYEDHLIPVEFARQSYDLLKQHGAVLEYKEDREMDNRLRDRGVLFLKDWIQTRAL